MRFVESAGALPMPVPVGPEPQADPVAVGRRLDLLALMDERAASVVSPVLAAVLDEAERLRVERDEFCDRVDTLTAVAQGNKRHVVSLTTECQRLTARVAELEAERHSTNEAPGGTYPPALPWAALMDDEDLEEFLAELTASIVGHDGAVALAEIERTCSTWRLIAEAQHGHNTAPGPDAMTAVVSSVASLREPEGEFYPFLHREGRVPHDLPETGGDGRG